MNAASTEANEVRVFLAAMVLDAEAMADRTAAFLARLGLVPTRRGKKILAPVAVPADVLLTMGALTRLAEWEQAGLSAHVDATLPSSTELIEELVDRCNATLSEDQAEELPDVYRQVVRAWMQNFSWSARGELGADVVLKLNDRPDDLFAELASFLWQHRNLVEQLES